MKLTIRPNWGRAKKNKLSAVVQALMLLPCLFLTACELPVQPGDSPATPPPTATLPPLALAVDVKDDAIIVSIPADPPSFNAYLNNTGYEALIGELVYGALAEIGPDGNYYPELAAALPTLENGGLGNNGRTVTWSLRPGLHWSDGEPFTSGDVRFTWQALRDSGIWAPGFDLIENIETPDPLTAIVHYREFYPNYLIQFGGQGTGVLPAHHCGNPDEMLFWDCNFEPVSSGPFVLAQWIPGVRLTFEPNPHYFIPERPLASQLVLEIEPDPDLRRRQLERGNTHLDLWPDDPELARMESSGSIIVFKTDPARFVLRLVPNLSRPGSLDSEIPHPALADARVRQAVRYALNVGRLNEEAFQNRGRPVATELFQFGCDISPYPYDPGLAAALLNEAGWVLDPGENVRRCRGCGTAAEGAPLTLKSYTYVEFGDELETAHRLIKGMLAEVGIDLQRETVEGSRLWNTWANNGLELRGNFDLDLWDDGYYGVDPTTYLTDYFDPRSIPTRDNPVAGLNVSRYRNLDLIDIFDALHAPLPNNRRRVLICDLAAVLHQDLPHIPLLALPDVYALNLALQGVSPHIYDTVTWNAGDWHLRLPPPE
ncbi:MAG: peptide ABC transporter substrate-binding protein [Anaerolineae bacterium]|nr:peptide ABC transporter substrate-binding protein [Anaerolineae bacterium]